MPTSAGTLPAILDSLTGVQELTPATFLLCRIGSYHGGGSTILPAKYQLQVETEIHLL